MARRDTPCTYEDELRKNPELKESDIQILREWCAKQPHLPKISDARLAVFLHHKKFRVEPTKTAIETYFTMRTHSPELFADRDFAASKELQIVSKTFAYCGLEKLTDDGYKIVYAKLMVSDPSYCYFNECMKYVNMTADLWHYTEGTTPGVVVVYNVQHVMMRHLSHLNFMTLKKYILYLQEALPMRVKGFHFVNPSPIIRTFMDMIKPLIKNKLLQKIHFHSTMESLAEFVPLDALPNEDGGTGGKMEDLMAETVKWVEDNSAWFKTEEATMRVNESLRPGKAKTSSDLFGAEGSFKMLDID